MKTYLADTNVYLRFLLQDEVALADRAEEYLIQAKQKQIKLIFLSAVVLEMGFVLQKVYKLSASEVAKHLLRLVKTSYVEVEDRQVWLKTLLVYGRKKIDLLDIYLFEKAKDTGVEILSFDKDFKRL